MENKLKLSARIRWLLYDFRHWPPVARSNKALYLFFNRLFHRRAYRLLPDDLKGATISGAIDRLAHDRFCGAQAEKRAARLGVRAVKLERENADLRLQLSCQGVPEYRKILETYGLDEADVS